MANTYSRADQKVLDVIARCCDIERLVGEVIALEPSVLTACKRESLAALVYLITCGNGH